MTASRLDVDHVSSRGGTSQLLAAAIAAAIVLLVGLLLALATAPKQNASPKPRVPVTGSTPVLTPSSEIG